DFRGNLSFLIHECPCIAMLIRRGYIRRIIDAFNECPIWQRRCKMPHSRLAMPETDSAQECIGVPWTPISILDIEKGSGAGAGSFVGATGLAISKARSARRMISCPKVAYPMTLPRG